MEYYTAEDVAQLQRPGVRIELPEWLFGNTPTQARSFAGWDLQECDDSSWYVRNIESVSGERPRLLKVSRVGTSIDRSNAEAYKRLENLAAYDYLSSPETWERAVAVHHQIEERYPDNLAAKLTSFRTLIAGAPSAADLPGVAALVMGELFDDETAPNASLHLIEVSEQLSHRYGMTRVLLQRQRPPSEESGFRSSIELMQDISVGLSAYLEPLVTSLSPRVWGVTAPRAGGVLVLSLGIPVKGRPQLSSVLGMSGRDNKPDDLTWDQTAPADAFRTTISWWTSRLNLVFSHLTEPSNYEVGGTYDAPSALERLLNFEQICRSCQVIATVSDEHARRLALFHVIDSLGGLIKTLDWAKLTSLNHNRKLLDSLYEVMPEGVRAVLLPRAARAVAALEKIQEGFFLPSRLTPTGLLRPDGKGVETEVPLATAASEWLHVIRNSQHGYDKTPSPRDRALLAAHSGAIPIDLADLAWLNLLRVLAFPELLRLHPRKAK